MLQLWYIAAENEYIAGTTKTKNECIKTRTERQSIPSKYNDEEEMIILSVNTISPQQQQN